MEKKLLLIIKEGVVSYARLFDAIWVEKATPVFPYRSNDTPGNPYARALRLRDHNINRGVDVKVLVLDGGDPRDYYYKKYDPDTEEFSLNGETEEERQNKIKMIDAFFGLEQEDYSGIEYMKPDYNVYKDYVSEELFDSLRTRVRKHELFSDEEYEQVEDALDLMDEDKRIRAIYTIASNHSRVCIDPIVGKLPRDRDQEHIQETKNIAIEWWERLLGTQHEKKALMEIARICSWSCEESRAVSIYEDLISRDITTDEEKDLLRDRIETLGTGRGLFDEAQSFYDEGKYQESYYKLVECKRKATGAVKTFLRQSINTLRGKLLIEEAKNANTDLEKRILKDKAMRYMYPERYMHEDHKNKWEEEISQKEANISDRDYFNTAE